MDKREQVIKPSITNNNTANKTTANNLAKTNHNKNTSASSTTGTNKPKPTTGAPSASTSQPAKKPTTGTTVDKNDGFSYDEFNYGDYMESEAVQQANALLQQQLNSKPGEYQSTWQGQIDSMIDKILNREKFSYDLNSDALYQQYKDQYTSLGKLAMQDTMGQAAAMTGGYGSSYASAAGNQAYQSYLSQLNDVVPELYGMALDRYNAEGSELYNQYSLLADQENQDYGRYMDEYNKYIGERDYLTGRYDSERSYDYGKYSDDRAFDYGVYSDDKNYAYNEYRNAIADEQWQKQYDESVRQYNENMEYTKEQDAIANDQWNKTHELNVNADKRAEEAWEMEQDALNDSTKAYSGTTSSGTSYNNGGLTNGQVKELQTALGVSADGYFGPKSKEAAGGMSAEEAYAKYVGGSSESSPSYITDLEEIQQWQDGILSAETEEDALFFVERLEKVDPEMADALWDQWRRKHGLSNKTTDTTVGLSGNSTSRDLTGMSPLTGQSYGGGSRGHIGTNLTKVHTR